MIKDTPDFLQRHEMRRQTTNNHNYLTHAHTEVFNIHMHSVLNNSVRLALLFLFSLLGNGSSERFKGLLSIIQLAMAELGLKPSSVSVSYCFS